MNGTELVAYAARRYPAFLERLAALVALDRGSGDLPGLDEAARLVRAYAAADGFTTALVPVEDAGRPLASAVVARRAGRGTRTVLLAGHLDTVFPAGTAARRPLWIDEGAGRAYGPGVCDDAGGLLAGLAAAETLRLGGDEPYGELVVVATPDEEIGSPGSRPLLAELAAQADVILCLECARDNGDLVRARAGVADVEINLYGKAAHAGIEPERGANAALALARLTVALQRLPGVNVGLLQAGTRPNVVAERGRIVADVRACDPGEYRRVLEAIEALAATEFVPEVTADLRLIAPTPPWSGGAGTAWLLELAGAVGDGLGLAVTAAATGGCADANLLAESGRPVLDGLGPVGGGDHGPDEWLDLDSVVPRVALLAGLIGAACASDLPTTGPGM
ncbi:M20/M25/M40 family metallo-hydrolase [Hamadaea tsunoensis]|uniref:M20/M25/M40 family metallo-hydrolase n=1 Tax=Hamadaea tsunoensis TaxID=53368 RepID=UPI00042A44A4|nr:M20/M25/M40 family metallo-hydrolase [Hamadaea tsunoensis]